MSRAAMAGDIAGSRFERSIWSGKTVADAKCIGYDVPDPRIDARGETAAKFELFHPTCHITDDTVLTIAVMEWHLRGGDPRTTLRAHFRRCSCPELFGRYFRAWANNDGETPCGSVGNGAAMRISPVGYVATSVDEAVRLANENARATHSTPDSIAGAEAIAVGVFLARSGAKQEEIVRTVGNLTGYNLTKTIDGWRAGYQFTSDCQKTVPIAFRAFLETTSHESAIRAAMSVGGDSDTIACMAAALAGAYWGIPKATADRVASYLDAEALGIVKEFEEKYPAALRIA